MSDHAKLNFSELVEEYYTPLYRFAYSLAKNEHEASDLTQQTFV
ncbi:MAG: RNA polymerase sigma factor, partial [Puniceicoccales bacterium]